MADSCGNCGRQVPDKWCIECQQALCARCDQFLHSVGTLQRHTRAPDSACALCVASKSGLAPVVHWCRECRALFCSRCSRVIHATGTRHEHVLVTVSGPPRPALSRLYALERRDNNISVPSQAVHLQVERDCTNSINNSVTTALPSTLSAVAPARAEPHSGVRRKEKGKRLDTAAVTTGSTDVAAAVPEEKGAYDPKAAIVAKLKYVRASRRCKPPASAGFVSTKLDHPPRDSGGSHQAVKRQRETGTERACHKCRQNLDTNMLIFQCLNCDRVQFCRTCAVIVLHPDEDCLHLLVLLPLPLVPEALVPLDSVAECVALHISKQKSSGPREFKQRPSGGDRKDAAKTALVHARASLVSSRLNSPCLKLPRVVPQSSRTFPDRQEPGSSCSHCNSRFYTRDLHVLRCLNCANTSFFLCIRCYAKHLLHLGPLREVILRAAEFSREASSSAAAALRQCARSLRVCSSVHDASHCFVLFRSENKQIGEHMSSLPLLYEGVQHFFTSDALPSAVLPLPTVSRYCTFQNNSASARALMSRHHEWRNDFFPLTCYSCKDNQSSCDGDYVCSTCAFTCHSDCTLRFARKGVSTAQCACGGGLLRCGRGGNVQFCSALAPSSARMQTRAADRWPVDLNDKSVAENPTPAEMKLLGWRGGADSSADEEDDDGGAQKHESVGRIEMAVDRQALSLSSSGEQNHRKQQQNVCYGGYGLLDLDGKAVNIEDAERFSLSAYSSLSDIDAYKAYLSDVDVAKSASSYVSDGVISLFEGKVVKNGGKRAATAARTPPPPTTQPPASALQKSAAARARKSRSIDTMEGVHKDWHSLFQKILDLPTETDFDKLVRAAKVNSLSISFARVVSHVVKTIVHERSLPEHMRTYRASSERGVAGGEKYRVGNIFVKFASDWKSLYGGDCFAMKAASSELRSIKSYMKLGIRGLRFPLIILLDYCGYRICASSLLPIGRDSLVYGSDDQARTVHFDDEECNALMKRAAGDLNLKGHFVGLNHEVPIYSCADIEVHRGSDNFLYLLDAARVFPPEAQRKIMSIVTIFASTSSDSRTDCMLGAIQVNDVSVTSCAQELPSILGAGDGAFDVLRLPDGIIMFFQYGKQEAHGGEEPAPQNVGASMLAGRLIRGDVVVFNSVKAVHLYRMLRPELVKAYKTPLSSDASTLFGQHDGAVHNREVKEATKYLIDVIIPKFVEDQINAQSPIITGMQLIRRMHAAGVNCRHLGIVRGTAMRVARLRKQKKSQRMKAAVIASVCLTEMVSRVFKDSIRATLRQFALTLEAVGDESTDKKRTCRDDRFTAQLKFILAHEINFAVGGQNTGSQRKYGLESLKRVRERFAEAKAADDTLPDRCNYFPRALRLHNVGVWNTLVKIRLVLKYGQHMPVFSSDEVRQLNVVQHIDRFVLFCRLCRQLGVVVKREAMLNLQANPFLLDVASPLSHRDIDSIRVETMSLAEDRHALIARVICDNNSVSVNTHDKRVDELVKQVPVHDDDGDARCFAWSSEFRNAQRQLNMVATTCGEYALESAMAHMSMARVAANIGSHPRALSVTEPLRSSAADDMKDASELLSLLPLSMGVRRRLLTDEALTRANNLSVRHVRAAYECVQRTYGSVDSLPVELVALSYQTLGIVQQNRGFVKEAFDLLCLAAYTLELGFGSAPSPDALRRSFRPPTTDYTTYCAGGHPALLVMANQVLELLVRANVSQLGSYWQQVYRVCFAMFPPPHAPLQSPKDVRQLMQAPVAWRRLCNHVFGSFPSAADVHQSHMDAEDFSTFFADDLREASGVVAVSPASVQVWRRLIELQGRLDGAVTQPDVDAIMRVPELFDLRTIPPILSLTLQPRLSRTISTVVAAPPGRLLVLTSRKGVQRVNGAHNSKHITSVSMPQGKRNDDLSIIGAAVDGSLYAVGSKAVAMLGMVSAEKSARMLRETTDMMHVTRLSGKHVLQVVCGAEHVLLRMKSGLIFAAGASPYGQLGVGLVQRAPCEPRVVGRLEDMHVVSVACAPNSSFAIARTGIVYAWGSNEQGMLGVGKSSDALPFSAVPTKCAFFDGTTIRKLACSPYGSVALARNGRVFLLGQLQNKLRCVNRRVNPFPVLWNEPPRIVDAAVCESGEGLVAICSRGQVYVAGSAQVFFQGIHSRVEHIGKAHRDGGEWVRGRLRLQNGILEDVCAHSVSAGGDTFHVLDRKGNLYEWGYFWLDNGNVIEDITQAQQKKYELTGRKYRHMLRRVVSNTVFGQKQPLAALHVSYEGFRMLAVTGIPDSWENDVTSVASLPYCYPSWSADELKVSVTMLQKPSTLSSPSVSTAAGSDGSRRMGRKGGELRGDGEFVLSYDFPYVPIADVLYVFIEGTSHEALVEVVNFENARSNCAQVVCMLPVEDYRYRKAATELALLRKTNGSAPGADLPSWWLVYMVGGIGDGRGVDEDTSAVVDCMTVLTEPPLLERRNVCFARRIAVDTEAVRSIPCLRRVLLDT